MAKRPTTVKVSFQKDLNSNKIIGSIVNGSPDPDIVDINQKIASSIRRAFNNLSDWIVKFDSLVASGQHREAFQVFNNNKGTLQFSDSRILNNLLRLNERALASEDRKQFTIYLIAVASRENRIGGLEERINSFLGEFGNELANGLKQSVLLSRANASAVNKKYNVARTYYETVLGDSFTSLVDQAYAWRGLSIISSDHQEMVSYRQKGIDKFLEAGERQQAIIDLAFLARQLEKENPTRALALIDKAIQLYDLNINLDKEFAASLYHRRSAFLQSMGENKEALRDAETACTLRENLIGNEHERYSSYGLAETLSKINQDVNKEKIYADKLAQLEPLVRTEEFKLETELKALMDKGKIVSENLILQLQNSGSITDLFTAYLVNGLHESYSFQKKMEWLDKAAMLLNDKDFTNQHHSILYFSIAEEWRKNGSVDQAKANYERSLEHNPFQHMAIQNCGGMLWAAKRWSDSEAFFKRQIDRFGDSPTLSYAYGRSLFELKQYSEAIPYLQKAKGKVEGLNVDPYLLECLNHTTQSTIKIAEKSPTVEDPISLDEFQKAIEEFAQSISSNSRMHFWQSNGKRGHKWTVSPEEKGKQLLITALNMKFGNDSIEIIQERPIGAGIIDLYLILRGGLKIIVELKICGANYSSTYAISGEDQLIHYIKNSQTRLGYLIVFDGRTTEFGKGLTPLQSIGNITIYTTAIELAPKVF